MAFDPESVDPVLIPELAKLQEFQAHLSWVESEIRTLMAAVRTNSPEATVARLNSMYTQVHIWKQLYDVEAMRLRVPED